MSDVGLTVDLMHFEQREGWQSLDVAIVLSVQNVYLAEETLKFEGIVAARFNRLWFANWICIGVPGQTGVKDKPWDGNGWERELLAQMSLPASECQIHIVKSFSQRCKFALQSGDTNLWSRKLCPEVLLNLTHSKISLCCFEKYVIIWLTLHYFHLHCPIVSLLSNPLFYFISN